MKNHSLDHKRCTKDSLCFQWQRAESRVLRFLMEKHFELRSILSFHNKSEANNFVVATKNVDVMLGFFFTLFLYFNLKTIQIPCLTTIFLLITFCNLL